MSRPEERAAAALLETILGARLEARDVPGAPPSTHDYMVVRPGQPPAALEISTLADELRLGLTAAIAKHGLVLDTDELASSWWVELREDAQHEPYRKVPERLVKALARLEAAGIARFDVRLGSPPEGLADIADLPIDYAAVSDDAGPGRVVVLQHSRSSTPWSGHASFAVEIALAGDRLKGERDKLRRSGTQERHLLLWVDTTLFDAYVGLCLDSPPEEGPQLPPEITDLWVVARCPTGTVVWHTFGEGWESRTVPS